MKNILMKKIDNKIVFIVWLFLMLGILICSNFTSWAYVGNSGGSGCPNSPAVGAKGGKHNYVMTYDENYHWFVCTLCGYSYYYTNASGSKGSHSFYAYEDIAHCSECDYVKGAKPEVEVHTMNNPTTSDSVWYLSAQLILPSNGYMCVFPVESQWYISDTNSTEEGVPIKEKITLYHSNNDQYDKLLLAPLQKYDGKYVYCKMSNEIGESYTEPVQLTLSQSTSIVNPKDIVVSEGSNASFTVRTSPNLSNPTYTWYEIVDGLERKLTENNVKIYKSSNSGKPNTTAQTVIKIKETEDNSLGKGIVSFEYLIDSEVEKDLFSISIKDATRTKNVLKNASGKYDWFPYEEEFEFDSNGEIVITLTYSKNGSIDSGLDCGAIRNLKFKTTGIESNYQNDDTYTIISPNPTINDDIYDQYLYDTASYHTFGNTNYEWWLYEGVTVDNSYGWNIETYKDDVIYKSSNSNIDSTYATASIEINMEEAKYLSFDYRISSEYAARYHDGMWLNVVGNEKIVVSNGRGQSQKENATYDGWYTFGEVVTPDANGKVRIDLLYRKDRAVSVYDDAAMIRNLAVGNIVEYECSMISDEKFEISGSDWETVSYSGYNTSTLTIPGDLVTLDMNKNQYYCKMRNGNDILDSRIATLYVVDDVNKALIVEWAIGKCPNLTVELPIPSIVDNSFIVDWGDNNIEAFTEEAFPKHTYLDGYNRNIKIYGKVKIFGYINEPVPTQSGTYKGYYSFTQGLTKIIQWGEIEATRYGFSRCENLEVPIPLPKSNTFSNVKDMSYLFNGCTSLTEIPSGLFAGQPQLLYFSNAFDTCVKLQEIPAGLFADQENAMDFYKTFANCSWLHEIPETTFTGAKNIENFWGTFKNCKALTSIPNGLFASNTKVTYFFETFIESGLTSIPANLFSNNKEVESFEGTFAYCENLDNLPQGLFDANEKVESFYYTFAGCPKLYFLPEGLFAKTTNVIDFCETFYASGVVFIPENLFANTPNVESFDATFMYCENLQEVPEGLFVNNKGITSNGDYVGGYAATFFGCPELKKAVVDSRYVGYMMYYECNKLTDITIKENVEEIFLPAGEEGAFCYTGTNPDILKTTLTTTNEVALSYDWEADNRYAWDEKASLITEWNIPNNTTINLPIPSNANNKFGVDWGDGTFEVYTTESFPNHTYTNSGTQSYTIKICGTVDNFGYFEEEHPDVNSEYCTYVVLLTKLHNWGEVNATKYGFAWCQNLTSAIPSPNPKSFEKIESFTNLFYHCDNLSGTIPADLFANCPNVDSFYRTFAYAGKLTGEIPSDLFKNVPKVTTFDSTFYGCKGLNGTIPETLFANNKDVEVFYYTFAECVGLKGSIPVKLFENNIEATNVGGVFSGCIGLTGNIPADLFVKNTKITNFSKTFNNCSGLTGMIPAKLFAGKTKVTTYEMTFNGCSSLVGGELQIDTTNVTNMNEMFAGCTSLKNIVLGESFKNLNGTNMFQNCSALRAIIMLNNPEIVSDVGTLASETTLGLANGTIIYVPYADDEVLYQQANKNISEEKIEQVIKAVPPNPDHVGLNQEYVDPGYTVAGYTIDNKIEWEQYGFYVEVRGNPVDTSEPGSEWIKYILKRN